MNAFFTVFLMGMGGSLMTILAFYFGSFTLLVLGSLVCFGGAIRCAFLD